MNYRHIYLNIIFRAQNDYLSRLKLKKHGMYFEKHHVLPRSLGGKNIASNIVLLTGREHFICHWLLFKMFNKGTIERSKMLFALWCMKSIERGHTGRYINARTYEYIRAEFASMVGQLNSKLQSGSQNSQYGKIWYTNAYTGASTSSIIPLKYPWYKGRRLFRGETMVLFNKTQQCSMILAKQIWDLFHSGNYTSFSEFTSMTNLPLKRPGILALFNKYVPISRTLWKDSTKPKQSDSAYVGRYYK